MTLEEVRQKIDEIDSQLLPLFQARMDCAREVAAIKKEAGLPVLNPEREQAILDRVAQRAGEYGGAARVLYSTLMEVSRGLQHSLLDDGGGFRALVEGAKLPPAPSGSIATFGRPGSFSHQAACSLFPGCSPVFFPSFSEIFAAVASGQAQFGVLPVENSSAGSVGEVYDLILKYRFFIVGAETLGVRHCLAAPEGAAPLERVYSHPQALAQCSQRIAQLGLSPVTCSSTAEAAFTAAREKGAAAVCSEEAAAAAGLAVLERNIQNTENNCTRFILISRELYIPQDANKISLCFSLPHTTGSLHGVLSRFAQAGLNLTKIESRPIPGRKFEYDFYLDFTGSVKDSQTIALLSSLYVELPRFSFLGNYTERE